MGRRRGRDHLYSAASQRSFEQEYGKKKGDRVFGATVGKVRREQLAKKVCKNGCGRGTVHYHGAHRCCGSQMCCARNMERVTGMRV